MAKKAKVSAKAQSVSKKNAQEKRARPKQNLSQTTVIEALVELGGKGTNEEIGKALKPNPTSRSNVARITASLLRKKVVSKSKHAEPVFKLNAAFMPKK